MPVFEVQTPGGVYEVEAPDENAALAWGKSQAKPAAAPKARAPAQRNGGGILGAALDAVTRYDPESGLNAIDAMMPLPIADEVAGIGGAISTAAGNFGRMFTGEPMQSEAEGYRTARAGELARRKTYAKNKPVEQFAGELLSSVGGASPAMLARAAPAVAASRAPLARAGRAATTAAKGAGAGALAGGLYGFADKGEGVFDRLEDMLQGGALGAAGGAVFSLAAPPLINFAARAGGKVGGAFRDVARWATTQPLQPGEAARIAPRDTEAAEEIVGRMLAETGLTTPQAVAARHAEFAGDPSATTAELVGRRGVQTATALARRPGQTPDRLDALSRARREETPGRILDSARDDLGVDPELAQGNIEGIVERGQAQAKPLYQAAFADAPPIASPTLDRLRARPAVQTAERDARTLAANKDRDPDALGLRDMDATPDGFTTAAQAGGPAPPLDTLTAQALSAIRAGVAGRLRQGPSLQTWLKRNGGVSDATGDLRSMGMGEAGRQDVRRAGGMSAEDRAPLAAYEAGFFPDLNRPPTPDEFRAAVMGAPRYARQPDPAQADLVARLGDVEERLASVGLDARNASDEQIARAFAAQDEWEAANLGDMANREPLEPEELYGAPRGAGDAWEPPPPERIVREEGPGAPRVEPTPSTEANLETWDFIKRVLDRQAAELDPATRRPTAAALAARDTLREMRPELDRLSGGEQGAYAQARSVSGDYLSVEAAYRNTKGKLTRGRVGEVRKAWEGAGQGERVGMQSAVVDDLLEMAEKGQLRAGRITVPGVQAKLELMFGRDQARAFVEKAEARARLNATGSRMSPASSSVTGEVSEFNREADLSQGLRPLVAAGQAMAQMRPIAALGQLTIGGLLKLAANARTTGMAQPVRDEVGRLLTMDADELMELVRRRTAAGALQNRRPAPALPGGLAGGVLAASAAGP